MRCSAALLATFAVLTGAAPVAAQVTVHRMTLATAATPAAEKALGTLRADLVKLVAAQDEYFVRHSTYAWDLSQLGFAPTGGARFVITMAGPKGFHVDATHAQLKGAESVHVMRETKEGGMSCGGEEKHDMGAMRQGGAAPVPGGEHAVHDGGSAGQGAKKGCSCPCKQGAGEKAGGAAAGQHQH